MNVLVVGLGSIAKKHIAALKEINAEVNIYALRSSLTSVPYAGVQSIFSLSELEDITVDFAIISTPTAEHRKTIESLLFLKCPLLIEKPLYCGLEIEDLIESIRESGILTYVACNLRFLGCLQFLKENLAGKRINEVNVYCGSYLPEWRAGSDWRKTYSANKVMGGGVHIDLIHEIDYIYWLFGSPDKTHKLFRNVSSLDIDAYDYANYIFEYKNFTASVVLNYYRKDYRRTIELILENETWEVDLAKNRVTCSGKVLFESEENVIGTYKKQMQHFVNSIKDKKHFNDIEEAYKVLSMCLE